VTTSTIGATLATAGLLVQILTLVHPTENLPRNAMLTAFKYLPGAIAKPFTRDLEQPLYCKFAAAQKIGKLIIFNIGYIMKFCNRLFLGPHDKRIDQQSTLQTAKFRNRRRKFKPIQRTVFYPCLHTGTATVNTR